MISVVVPIYDERENLTELRGRLVAVLDATALPWEVLLVDDGSRDGSLELIRQFHADDPRFKLVALSRNFGHQPAVTAGIHHARGDCVVLLDGDLQDPPEVIPQMIAQWKEGYRVVLGERRSRPEHGPRGLGFRLFYPLMRRLSDLPTRPDDRPEGGANGRAGGRGAGLPVGNAGIFGLMDRVVVDHFNRLPERNRFIPGLRSWLGFKQTTVPYDRQPRARGEPKQRFGRLVKYAMDAMISFSYKPLRWVTYAGFCISGITFLLAIYYLVEFLYRHGRTYGSGFTTIIMCVLFLGGVQLISIGILGEYIGRIYEEIKQRPLYVVQETLGLGGEAGDDEGTGGKGNDGHKGGNNRGGGGGVGAGSNGHSKGSHRPA